MTKLDDANDAGGRNSEQCTLILTEGDSAKSLVIAGMSVAGRDKFGVFPLRSDIPSRLVACVCMHALCWIMPWTDTYGFLINAFVDHRGKLLNVRDAGVAQINGNAEINAIKQILGLQHGKVRPVFMYFYILACMLPMTMYVSDQKSSD